MYFEIVGKIRDVELIAAGKSVRERKCLQKKHGKGRWRKLKGTAEIKLLDGKMRLAELHWYEAHGVGRREYKIKRLLD